MSLNPLGLAGLFATNFDLTESEFFFLKRCKVISRKFWEEAQWLKISFSDLSYSLADHIIYL